MSESILIELAAVIVIGIFAQWLGWRIRMPSILLLLLAGIIAGPITGFLDPDAIFGEVLFPLVSFSVALILFEGGLSLRLDDLREVGRIVRNLVTIGALIVWVIISVAAYTIIGLELSLAILLGAILIVSGPTVVLPLLLHVRPTRRLSAILKWEGIIIDPVGAMIAVLVYEAILLQQPGAALAIMIGGIFKTILIGGVVGALGAGLLYILLKRFWLPDFLQNSVSLVLVIGTYTLSDLLQTESGLLAVTVMGIILANQKRVEIRQIIEFKENLRILLLSGLFILLAARLDMEVLLQEVTWAGFAFLAVVVLIARPLSVWVSTLRSDLNWREKTFLSWMAPRGIVAASVSAVFALRLDELGYQQADRLVSLTFFTIIFTVTLYGFTAMPAARWLKVAQPRPQGLLIIGAHRWAQEIAQAVQSTGFRVLLVDTNQENVYTSQFAGLKAHHVSVLAEDIWNEVDLEGIGKLIALTSNTEVNSLAAIRFREIFNRTEVYQLCAPKQSGVSQELGGRVLFQDGASFTQLHELFNLGAKVSTLEIEQGQTLESITGQHHGTFIPLFLAANKSELQVFSPDKALNLRPGQKLIALNLIEKTPVS